MSQRQFDDLTRALAGGSSRRNVLKALFVGLVAALFGGAAAEPALAGGPGSQFCNLDYPCTSGQVCVQNVCRVQGTCKAKCGPCQACVVQPNGSSTCVDRCGPCGQCKAGVCVRKCNLCSDCRIDSRNIGVCTSICQRCEACSPPDGYTDDDPENLEEWTFGESQFCLSRCGPGRVCSNNQCVVPCAPNSLTVNGACFKRCSEFLAPCAGACGGACTCLPSNNASDPLLCVDTASATGSCAADADCPGGKLCSFGQCVAPCACPA